MKKTLFTVAMALGITIAAKAQVLFASDFETWTSVQAVNGWDGSKTNITTTTLDSAKKDSISPYHGSYCVNLVNAATSSKRFSSQPLSVTAGTLYNVRFWAKGAGKIKAGLYGVKYSTGFGYVSSPSYVTVSSPSWAVYNQTLLADSTNANAQFLFYVESTVAASGNLQLDSVTITVAGTVPNVSLYNIQYTTATPANSPYMNQFVTTGGIVTAVQMGGTPVGVTGYYLQTRNATKWAAVNVYDFNHAAVAVGDSITFSGQVTEYYNETEIQQVSNFTTVSHNNQALTPPTIVAFGGTNTIQNEQNEGLLIKVRDVTDIRYNTAQAWYVFSDSTITAGINSEDTVDNNIYTYGYTLGKKYNITGVVHFEYAMWIEPRNQMDIDSINITAGVEQHSNILHANVYPNPVAGELTIQLPFSAEKINVSIIDILGREMMATSPVSGNQVLLQNIDLPAGVYMVKIIADDKQQLVKIIKQ
jgi:hypothetical protein